MPSTPFASSASAIARRSALDTFNTTILAGLLYAYLLYRQSIQRPVTRRDFILPTLGAAYLTLRYLDHSNTAAQIFVQACAVLGVFSGLVAGGIVRVWRDEKTDLIFQFGGWRYAAVLFGLLAFRLAWKLFIDATGLEANVALLNDGLIALGIGNYLGRTLHVGVRAVHLTGWKPHLIPRHREVRGVRTSRPK